VANLLAQLATMLLLAALLGARGQGVFLTAVTLQAVLWSWINVGLAQGVAAQVAAAAGSGRGQRVADWVAYVIKLSTLLGLGGLGLGAVILPPVAEAWFDEPQLGTWAVWLCWIPVLEVPRNVAAIALQGTQRMATLARLEAGHALLRLFCVAGGALVTFSPEGPLLGLLVSSALSGLLAGSAYAEGREAEGSLLPSASELLRTVWRVPLWRGVRVGVRVAVLRNVSTLLCQWTPRLALGSLAGLEWVAYYHVAERILSLPILLTQGFSRALLPALGERAGRGDWMGLRRLFMRVTLLGGAGIVVALVLTLALTPLVTRLLFPADYAPEVQRFTGILFWAGVGQAFAIGIDPFFIATNRIKAWYVLSLLGLALCLPAALWLISSVPVVGPAWGTVVLNGWLLVIAGYAIWSLRRGGEGLPGPAGEPRGE